MSVLICSILLGVGVVFTIVCFLSRHVQASRKKKRLTGSEQDGGGSQVSLMEKLFSPAGEVLSEGWNHLTGGFTQRRRGNGKTSENEQIHTILRNLSGEKEGDRQFRRFRARKYGYVLAAVQLCLVLYLVLTAGTSQSGTEALFSLERPQAQEGGSRESVTLELTDGRQTVQKDFSLSVPAQELEDSKVQEFLTKALEEVLSLWDERVIASDVSFPTRWNKVKLSYTSLTPELLRSDGRLLTEPSRTQKQILVEVKAKLQDQSRTAVLTLYEASLEELTLSQRADLLIKKIQSGQYTQEEEIVLPKTDALQDTAVYTRKSPDVRMLWAVIFLLFPSLILISENTKYHQLWKNRNVRIEAEFPEFLEELSIVMGAGMSLSLAWQRLGADYRRERAQTGKTDYLYEQVLRTSMELSQGTAVREALERFSQRIPLPQVRRFTVMLTQSLRRGDSYLLEKLKDFSREAWEEKKNQVRKKSEEVDTKLIFPLMIMLVVVLLMVLTPALLSMQWYG